MNPAILADIVAPVFIFVSERYIRKPGEAKSFRVGTRLDKTTQIYLYSVLFILLSAPVLNYFRIAKIDVANLGWWGILLLLVGILIRTIAMLTLGKYYTRALLTTKTQEVMDSGMYRYIRHPGYLGTIIAGVGFSFAQMNWLTLVFTIVFVIVVYTIRINKEEEMLKRDFGNRYAEYMKRTWRLVPFIY